MQSRLLTQIVSLQADVAAAAPPAAVLDPWELVMDATPVVKLVIATLVLMSLACWFIVGVKLMRFLAADRQTGKFLNLFWEDDAGTGWTADRLEAVYAQVKPLAGSPLAKVFQAGYVELAGLQSDEVEHPADESLENVERSLSRARVAEMTKLEGLLSMLATTGSTAPFIGLFGTVWGIMNSFLAIGASHEASLDVVAPGIAEALIATAIGLVAAIPAVVAYNYFIRRLQVLESEVETFTHDMLNIVKRHFL